MLRISAALWKAYRPTTANSSSSLANNDATLDYKRSHIITYCHQAQFQISCCSELHFSMNHTHMAQKTSPRLPTLLHKLVREDVILYIPQLLARYETIKCQTGLKTCQRRRLVYWSSFTTQCSAPVPGDMPIQTSWHNIACPIFVPGNFPSFASFYILAQLLLSKLISHWIFSHSKKSDLMLL